MLIVLVGIARSGKSTLAREWEKHKIDIEDFQIKKRCWVLDGVCQKPRIVVNADQIRLTLHGWRFYLPAEGFVHAIKNLIIQKYLDMSYDVLVDGTHTTRNSLLEMLNIDPLAHFYIVDEPAPICKYRAEQTGQEDLLPVIDRMDKQLSEWKNNAKEYINELRKIVNSSS